MRLVSATALILTALTMTAHASITAAPWGTTAKGEPAQLFTLKGAGGVEARITNYGGRIVDLLVPTKTGGKADVMLGYDTLKQFEDDGVYGAIIGRFANRINHSSFTLDGKTYHLDNPTSATYLIHSGAAGFQKRVWHAAMHDGAEPALELSVTSPDGEGGFPGTVTATVIYTVTKDNALRIAYRAVTDKPTVVNLTNHSYFNIGGEESGSVLDQTLQVFADHYTPADQDGVPTGAIADVKGTPLDFTHPVRVGDRVDSQFDAIKSRKGLDNNFIIRGAPGTLRPAVKVFDARTGIEMDLSTTEPAVQVYSNNIAKPVAGKNGHSYPARSSLSLEAQHYPDSPNHPNFPTTEITPQTPFHAVTIYKFSVK